MEKANRKYIIHLRHALQWGILLFLVYAGYKFFLFEQFFADPSSSSLKSAAEAMANRPPSVEGFLPIGGLMALKLWITEGIFDRIHPAGLVIFTAAIVISLILRKGFCSWLCPVGTVSELTWRLGQKIFGRNFRIHRYIDYPLRSVKYLLFAFFFYVIVVQMPSPAIFHFLEGDYYKIADVKMLYFFTKMTKTTMISLFILFAFSLVYKNFWCRYLCPYGAMLGIAGLCSPVRITRNEEACTHCKQCTRNCPSLLKVDEKESISSAECTGCLTCVSNCPAKGALDVSLPGKRTVHPLLYAVLIIAVFFGAIGLGKVTGKWDSAVTPDEYRRIIPSATFLDHP
jgi:ferredoxin